MHISFSHLFHFGSFSSPSPSCYCQQAPDTTLDETPSSARARAKKRRIKLLAKFDRFLGTMSIENVAAPPVKPLFNHPMTFIGLREPRLDSTVMCPGRESVTVTAVRVIGRFAFSLGVSLTSVPVLQTLVWHFHLPIGAVWRPLLPRWTPVGPMSSCGENGSWHCGGPRETYFIRYPKALLHVA